MPDLSPGPSPFEDWCRAPDGRSARVDPAAPLRGVELDGPSGHDRLLGLQFDGGEAPPVTDRWVRGRDLTVVCEPADGRLLRARRVGGRTSWMSGTLVDFEYDGAGKISGVRQRSLSGGIGAGSEWNNGVNVQSVALGADGNS